MLTKSTNLLYLIWLVHLLNCGAKTGLEIYPPDADGDDIYCEEFCEDSTFCNPICRFGEECRVIPGPDCDDDDRCTEDFCDLETDQCVNRVNLVDEDGDEHFWPIDCGGTDCNDEDPLIYPGAPERCNGIDDDCDELIDEGADLIPWTEEVAIAASDDTDTASSIAFAEEEYIYGFWDYRDGDADVYLQRISTEGDLIDEQIQVTTSAGDGFGPSIVWNGLELGVVWNDRRDGNFEIYFARFDSELRRLTGDVRVTNEPEWSVYPRIIWSGREYLVIWQERRTGSFETFAQRIGPFGLVDSPVQLSEAGSSSQTSESPEATFDGQNYHVVWLEGGLARFDLIHTRFDEELSFLDSRVLSGGLPGSAREPKISSSSGSVGVIWEQESPDGFEAYFVSLTSEGNMRGEPESVHSASIYGREGAIVWANDGFAIVFSGLADFYNLYFSVFDPQGVLTQDHTSFVTAQGDSIGARLSLGPGEIGVAWSDTRSGTYDAYFTKLLCAGL